MLEKTRRIPFELEYKGNKYVIATFLTTGAYSEYCRVDKIEDISYREKVAMWVSSDRMSTGEPLLTKEDVLSLNDELLEKYINAFMQSNVYINKVYIKLDIEDIYQRFWVSIFKGTKALMEKNIATAIQNFNVSTESIAIAAKTFNTISTIWKSSVESIIKFWSSNVYQSMIKNISQGLQTFSTYYSTVLSNITIPGISEERKKKLEKSYKQWGKYGWTIIDESVSDNLFNLMPMSQLEADELALHYCNAAAIKKLHSYLMAKGKKKIDIKEAIECYEQKHYKACALILFSVIDSILIRKQNRNTKLKTGVGAISLYKEKVEEKLDLDEMFWTTLEEVNLFSCLFMFFEDTNNFGKKMSSINRNYLDHGMTFKKVRKKDCIKLFLLLYNLIYFIENNDKKKK